MVYVADVERSLAFYALLGFVAGDRVRMEVGGTPVTQWASAACIGTGADGKGKAAVFFARADPVPVPEQQGVALYMYCDDVAGLRAQLLAAGVRDGGRFTADSPGKAGGAAAYKGVAFEITRPFYMPMGELRVADPDGYMLLIGQRG